MHFWTAFSLKYVIRSTRRETQKISKNNSPFLDVLGRIQGKLIEHWQDVMANPSQYKPCKGPVLVDFYLFVQVLKFTRKILEDYPLSQLVGAYNYIAWSVNHTAGVELSHVVAG